MKLCFNEMTVKKNGSIQNNIALCPKYGFGEIELLKGSLIKWLRKGHTLQELKALLDDNGVKLASLNAVEGVGFNSKGQMRLMKESAHLLFYSCRQLGCDTMEVIAAFNAPETDREKIIEETAASYAQIADVAAEYGIKLAMEFMATPGSSVNTFDLCLDVLRKTDRPNAGMLLDTWHFYAGGGKPEDILKLKPHEVNMVHISDSPAGEPLTIPRSESFWAGEGVIPVVEILKNLKTIGYDGSVSVEVMSPAVHELPLEEGFAKAAETTKAVMQAAGVL